MLLYFNMQMNMTIAVSSLSFIMAQNGTLELNTIEIRSSNNPPGPECNQFMVTLLVFLLRVFMLFHSELIFLII